MNKWLALVIGIFIVILGCAAASSYESRTAALVNSFAAHVLALAVFIVFLRKHTPVLLAGIMFQVIVLLGVLMAFVPGEPQHQHTPLGHPASEELPGDGAKAATETEKENLK